MDFSTSWQAFLEDALRFLPKLVAALVIFVVAVVLSGLAARWARRAASRRIDDEETLRLISWVGRWTVLILGTLVALDQVDFDVTGFAAGLGIAGLTIGFALQDITRNMVAGVLILIRQPFDIGDFVETGGHSGTVTDVTIRDTVLRTLEGETVIVPNLDVFTKPIVNYTDEPLRRRTVNIGLGYGEEVKRARELFMAAIQSVDGVLADPSVKILSLSLGDSALNLEARFWIDQRTHGHLDVQSDVVQAIKECAEREGIDLPYPVQTVRLEGPWPPVA